VAGATALWVVTVQLIQAALEPLAPGEHEVHTPETRVEHEISLRATPTA
jgi:hypothetical protein